MKIDLSPYRGIISPSSSRPGLLRVLLTRSEMIHLIEIMEEREDELSRCIFYTVARNLAIDIMADIEAMTAFSRPEEQIVVFRGLLNYLEKILEWEGELGEDIKQLTRDEYC